MKNYLDFQITDDLKKDIQDYFFKYDRKDTFEHTLDVINELFKMKNQFGGIEPGSEIACYCHDLGRVVSSDNIIEFCDENSIDISNEEKELPSILHQKISCFIAEKVFKIKDEMVLNAIRYHSTSRKNPSMTEIEVFLADKMSWNEDGYKELANDIRQALKYSKENAILYYLSDLNNNSENLKLYHSHSREAFEFFRQKE
ncbi:HD domain-containing protein [Clostridium sp. CS001]|uniref:HD domain-containing protein n=1 Tax=Clostridium sp. CS001 TaxID=2880648 RepID=UPI001CF5B29D|nr:HD domain-containing protein [Clostridium sp. CS001]MCB2291167.1 HD domain-containing protein [Clostridium sp. CS001]